MNKLKLLVLASSLVFGLSLVRADTPPPGAVKVKDAAGNLITSTLNSGKQSMDVNVTSTIMTSPGATMDTVASGSLSSSGSTLQMPAAGFADGVATIGAGFVGSINVQCVFRDGNSTALSTLQSGLWSSSAITVAGDYKFRGANGCQYVRLVYTTYTSGSSAVTLTGNVAVGNPIVSQPNASNLQVTSNAGSNLNTSLLALESGNLASILASLPSGSDKTQIVSSTNTNLDALAASPSSGQSGFMVMGAVTAFAPTYTGGSVFPMSMRTSGDIRVDSALANGFLSNIYNNVNNIDHTTASFTNLIGSLVPSSGIQMAASDGVNLQALNVDGSGNLKVNVASGPASQVVSQSTASNLNATVVGQVTANAGTNLNTSALALESGHVASVDSKLTNGTQQTQVVQGGNTLAIGSAGNVIVSGLSAVGISPTLNPVSVSGVDGGGLKRHLLTDTSGRIEIDTAQSLPLPTGASTSALQTSGNTSLSTIASNTGNIPAKGAATIANSTPVNIASDQTVPTNISQVGGVSVTASLINSVNRIPVYLGSGVTPNTTSPNWLDVIGGVDAGGKAQTLTIVSGALKTDGSAVTQPVSGSVTANIGTTNGLGLDSSLQSFQGSVAAGTAATKSGLIGGQFNSTLPTLTTGQQAAVQVDSSGRQLVADANVVLITGSKSAGTAAASSALVGAVYNTTVPAPTNGQQTALQADQFANLEVSQPDQYLTGASAQTATVNNILTNPSGATASDFLNYRASTVQVISTGTAGTFIFEGSNDNVNFQTIPVYNQLILTGTPITAAVTATSSQLIYTFPVSMRYVRLRIATTITGGSIQAFSRVTQASWTPAIFQVANNTAGSLQTTATVSSGTITTVSSVTSDQQAIPGIIADVLSAALTTTTTTGTLIPTFGNGYTVNIPVTVVSGTTPTLDVEIQESDDTGTNWVPIYDFPRIIATGSYRSPPLTLSGNRIRYVQTVGGTTPSFTRAISRLQRSNSDPVYRQMIDRTITLTTLSSTTANQYLQGTKNIQLVLAIGAATTPPSVQLQCSDDATANWYSIGSPLAAVASTTVQTTVTNMACQFARAIVTTVGTGVTSNYVLVRGF